MHSADKFNEKTACFITLQTVDSVDIFVRPVYKQVIVHTLNHFIESKGLIVYAWCLMTHHLHLLVAGDCKSLEELKSEYKRFTTKKILEAIETEPEGRKDWMLRRFECQGSILGFMKKHQIWQETIKPSYIDIDKDDLLLEKFDFIHQNPVRDRIVDTPAEYLYSSARDYTSSTGLVNITKLPTIELQLAAAETMNGNFFVKYIRN